MHENAGERYARIAGRHDDVPDDVIADQIAKVDQGVQLLGGDQELAEIAEDAIDHNLDEFASADANPGASHTRTSS